MSDEADRYRVDDHLTDRTLLVAAAYVVLQRGDEVLLQLRRGTGYMDDHWAVLAGHLEPDETVLEAAARESREEAGVGIDPADLEPLTTLHRLERGGPQVEQRCDWFFRARRWTGDPAPREPDRTARMGWFPLRSLPDPVVPHEHLVLEHLAAGRLPPPVIALARDAPARR